MKILITGGTGHIGTNLVKELSNNSDNNIRLLIHNNVPNLSNNIEQFKGDLLDIESLKRASEDVDIIYHLAAYVSLKSKHDKKCDTINIDGTKNLIEVAQNANIKKFVHFSTIYALNQAPFDTPVDENRTLVTKSNSPYSTSKAISEEIVLDACKNGFPAVIVNPTAVIGRNDNEPSPCGQMVKMFSKGKLPALIEGGFDWVDVRDVVNGAIAAASVGRIGERYILSGHYATLQEIADIIHSCGYAKPPKFKCPYDLAWTFAPLVGFYSKLTKQRPLYTRMAIEAVRSNENISSAKAEKELGYSKHSIEDTIQDTLNFFYNK